MSRARLASCLGACLLFFAATTPVAGHAALETATPGPGDTVVGSPPEILASFSQDLEPDRTSMVLRDSTGTELASGGEPTDDPREWRLELPSLAPGVYEVRWTTFSAEDGELHRDSYSFTVEPEASPSPSSTPSPTPSAAEATPSPTASPTPTVVGVSPTPAPSVEPDPSATGSGVEAVVPIIVVGLLGAVLLARWLLGRRR